LRQRIGLLNRLRPLTTPETAEYIKHRLGLAGYSREAFTCGAVQAIARASHGAPREINHICHLALCAAAMKGVHTVNLEMTQNIIARLEGRRIEVRSSPVAAPGMVPLPVTVPASTPDSIPLPASALPIRSDLPSVIPLSYGLSGKPNSMRWGSAAIAACAVLVAGTVFASPSIWRFARQEYTNLAPSILSRPPDYGAASSARSSSAVEVSLNGYDPDPQDGNRVIIVTSRTGQTIEELSRLYIGHFDLELYQRICALNPDLKDPNYLVEGQLILLPLPAGRLKKGIDTADPSDTIAPSMWRLAVARIKELFSDKKD